MNETQTPSLLSSVDPALIDTLLDMCRDSFVLSVAGPGRDHYLYRPKLRAFLLARGLDLELAFASWRRWVEWRESCRPFEAAADEAVQREFAAGKLLLLGRDISGNVSLTFKARRHQPRESCPDALRRLIFYCLEQLELRNRREGKSQVTVVLDLEGLSLANLDAGLLCAAKDLITQCQDYYPETLAKLHILYPNLLFKSLFAVVKPFLTAKTAAKVRLVDKPSELSCFFKPGQLPVQLGGLVQDPFFDYALKRDRRGPGPWTSLDALFARLDPKPAQPPQSD